MSLQQRPLQSWDLQELSEVKAPELKSVQQRLGPVCSAWVSYGFRVSVSHLLTSRLSPTYFPAFKSDIFMLCTQESVDCT